MLEGSCPEAVASTPAYDGTNVLCLTRWGTDRLRKAWEERQPASSAGRQQYGHSSKKRRKESGAGKVQPKCQKTSRLFFQQGRERIKHQLGSILQPSYMSQHGSSGRLPENPREWILFTNLFIRPSNWEAKTAIRIQTIWLHKFCF